MAHEFETGVCYEVPSWHRLEQFEKDPPKTCREAMVRGGMDWMVSLRTPYIYNQITGEYVAAEEHRAVVRSSDDRVLGMVGTDYRALQNVDAFEFFTPFVEKGEATISSAGSLRKGQRVWVLAKLPRREQVLDSSDKVDLYLLLYNSHDGTLAVSVQFTSVRVVCANTARLALQRAKSGQEQQVRIRHSEKMEGALKAVQGAIDAANATFSVSMEQFRDIARKQLPVDGLERYVREVFGVKEGEDLPTAWTQIQHAYAYAPGADLAVNTYWGAYNAITYWTDHLRGRKADTRLDSVLFGMSAKLKDRALKLALAA